MMRIKKRLLCFLLLGLMGGAQAQTWQAVGNSVPTGAVMFFALTSCPAGWVEGNGGAINRTTYPALYAALGGYTPDLRGQFVRGWDRTGAVDPGRALGSYQVESSPTSSTVGVAAGTTPAAGPLQAKPVHPRNIALLGCIKG